MITIVDYGIGNLGSVFNMLKKIGVKAEVSGDLDRISKAVKLILPGVGAFDTAMEKLSNTELRQVLDRKVIKEKVPLLGICLGMQLLTKGSEEGTRKGLGWVPAYSYRFPKETIKVPHMGWNLVKRTEPSLLTQCFDNEFRFYFVHSYFVKVESPHHSILQTTYGQTFDSGLQQDNIFGVQFHPEKSHTFGMQLFRNFQKL